MPTLQDMMKRRGKYVTARIGDAPNIGSHETGFSDPDGAYYDWNQKAQALMKEWESTLSPRELSDFQRDVQKRSDRIDRTNKIGSTLAKTIVGGIATGGALSAAGLLGGGAGAGIGTAEAAGALGGAAGTSGGGLTAAQAAGTLAGGASPAAAGGGWLGSMGNTVAGSAATGAGAAGTPAGLVGASTVGGGGLTMAQAAQGASLASTAAGALKPGGGTSGGTGGGTSGIGSWLTPDMARWGAAGLAGLAAVGALSQGDIDTAGNKAAAGQQMSIAQQQLALANQQGLAATQRQAQFDPKYAQLIDEAMASQRTNDGRSAQAWDQYTNVFMPAQLKLVDTAMNYDTAGRRNAAAAEAVAGVNTQLNSQRQAQQRDLGRAGVSMTAGRSMALDAAQRFAQAKQAAAADRTARLQVENTGIGLVNNAAQLGNSVAGTAGQFAGLGLNAGALGQSGLGQQQQTYNASLAPQFQGLSNASASTQAAGAQYTNQAGLSMQQQAQNNAGYAGLGSLAGTLLTAPTNSVIGDWFTKKP